MFFSHIDNALVRARAARKSDEEDELIYLFGWLTKTRKKWEDIKDTTIKMMQKL